MGGRGWWGGTPRVQPLSYPLAETELEWEGGGKQEWGVPSKPPLWGKSPFSCRVWGRPLPGRVTSHIRHLIPQLCIVWLSFLFFILLLFLRGHIGFIGLCQAFGAGTDEQVVLPAGDGGWW